MRDLRSLLVLFLLSMCVDSAYGQGASGSVAGAVTDPSGAVIPGATVQIGNPVSRFTRTTTTDSNGQFQFFNIPFNTYRLTVTMQDFATSTRSVVVSSVVSVTAPVTLDIESSATSVNVESGADLLENDSTMHTDIDRDTIARMPVESASSSLSSIVTLSSPGVTADSNGLFHGMGDHAESSFSVDGQPITDQQSKVFSNQLPSSAVQSLEVIDGAPPAEYGDKTSLVIKVTTRSGQGVTTPTGSITTSYGTFGTATVGGDLSYGGKRWGDFIAVDGLNTGRFLDPAEFVVFHDKGNEMNFFDRVDYQFNEANSIHTSAQYTRSWFQTPNTYDTLNIGVVDPLNGNPVGQADQRSEIETFNIAPTYTRVINDYTVFNLGPYLRRDAFNYYASKNPFADFGPIQQESIAQQRTLTNAGVHSDVSYAKGIQNLKVGLMYEQTFLRENNQFGVVDPVLNAPCLDANGAPLPGFTNPSQCPEGASSNPKFNPVLLPYDLTRGGSLYRFHGQTDVKELALYAQDQITRGNLLLNVGARVDFYNGLVVQRQVEPRIGVSYSIKPTNTVLRISYARTQETPFNENLVLSSKGCDDPVVNGIFATLGSCTSAPLNPGLRNEFHAGLQQAFTKHLVISGEYIWKYTHSAYDFSVFGNTPITFPIEWHNSKIPGFVIRANVPAVHGVSAFVVMSSVAARFFNPQVGGIGATVGTPGSNYPFRIDHDEKFNQTTHLEYELPFHKRNWTKSMWIGFNWRYDSGMVAASTPCYNVIDPNTRCSLYSFAANGNPLTLNGKPAINLSGLTPDEQFQAGLTCNGVPATPTSGFTICNAAGLTSTLLSIPRINTSDDDRNPARVAPRSLFDIALGDDNVFHKDKNKIAVRVTAVNVANKYALYNFLSTFSGTHYVTPRAITGQITYNF
jgi:hypothetical protein